MSTTDTNTAATAAEAPLQLVWDGVAYDMPINLTPREDGRIHAMTGCWGIEIMQRELPKLTTMGLAGLLCIAMQRRHGMGVDVDAILDDPDFNEKITVHVPPQEEPLPPADGAPLLDAGAPPTSVTPEASGAPGS